MTDDDMAREAHRIWNQIGDDPILALTVTRCLIFSCLMECDPEDRDMVRELLFFPRAGAQPSAALH